MPRHRHRSTIPVWKPEDSAGQTFTGYNDVTVRDTLSGKNRVRHQPKEFWYYHDSLPAHVRKVLDDTKTGAEYAAVYQMVLQIYPCDQATGRWSGYIDKAAVDRFKLGGQT